VGIRRLGLLVETADMEEMVAIAAVSLALKRLRMLLMEEERL